MSSDNPVVKVKGLGHSAQGSHHWWLQRVTAIALIPLSIWFVFSVIGHIGDSQAAVQAWVGQPIVAFLLVLYLAFMFFHAQLGVEEVIEDYVHSESLKMISLMLIKGLTLLFGLAAIFAVLRIAF